MSEMLGSLRILTARVRSSLLTAPWCRARSIAAMPSRDAMLVASLQSKAFYVGALGPKKRTAQMLDELDETPDPERLRAPAELDIGAETPEAIAISIVAEVQSVLKHRNGGPLRDRQAPIYDRK